MKYFTLNDDTTFLICASSFATAYSVAVKNFTMKVSLKEVNENFQWENECQVLYAA